MTSPPPSRPWWKKKRTWIAVALWLASAYPLSEEPAYYLHHRGWIRPGLYRDVWRRPISRLVPLKKKRPFGIGTATYTVPNDAPLARARAAYIRWWYHRALDHRFGVLRIERDPDGTVRAKGRMLDGRPHGRWEWFREDGTRLQAGRFDHGQRHGFWEWFREDGKRKQTGHFDRDRWVREATDRHRTASD